MKLNDIFFVIVRGGFIRNIRVSFSRREAENNVGSGKDPSGAVFCPRSGINLILGPPPA